MDTSYQQLLQAKNRHEALMEEADQERLAQIATAAQARPNIWSRLRRVASPPPEGTQRELCQDEPETHHERKPITQS